MGTRARPDVAPVVFIQSSDFFLLRDHSDEFRQACPDAAFALKGETADYYLRMYWGNDHWYSMLMRADSVLLMTKDSPDFKLVVREACQAIRSDTAWLWARRRQ
jgi:acetyl esterase/lipase